MTVVERIALEQLTIRTRGKRAVIGMNASSITTTYTGSRVLAMSPKEARFACFVVDQTSFVPRVTCDFVATAYRASGAPYEQSTICQYDGSGDVNLCTFEGSWQDVAKIVFDIRPTGALGFHCQCPDVLA